jgi:SNF family Na+-dependent transporter
MKEDVKEDGATVHENVEAKTGEGYIQRALRATLTIWLILTVVIVAAFGLSETLRVAGVEREANLLIVFLSSLLLILVVLWLLPRTLLTLKAEEKDEGRQRYIQQVLQSLALIWVVLAVVTLAAIGLYSLLRAAGIERNENLLISFLFSLLLILVALWLLPKSLLTLKAE